MYSWRGVYAITLAATFWMHCSSSLELTSDWMICRVVVSLRCDLMQEMFLGQKLYSLTLFINLRIHLKRAITDYINVSCRGSWWNADVPYFYGLDVDRFGIGQWHQIDKLGLIIIELLPMHYHLCSDFLYTSFNFANCSFSIFIITNVKRDVDLGIVGA